MAGDGFLFVDTGMDAKMRVELDPALHNGVQYAGFFDSAFPIRPYVQKAFQGANLTSAVKTYNSEMNSARESVEWSYQKNYALWPFMDFEKNQKAQRQAQSAILKCTYFSLIVIRVVMGQKLARISIAFLHL